MPETPILDLAQAPPEPRLRWPAKLVGIALGLLFGGVLILADQGLLPIWPWPSMNGLLLIPALYVGIAIHELGHLLAGKIVGLDAGGISVGAFVFTKSGSKWVVRFDRRGWAGGFFKPLTSTPDLDPSRFACLVAGGPVANLALTVVCGIVTAESGSGAWNWVGTLFWASLLLLVSSLSPYASGLNKSDGERLWQIVRHPEQARLSAVLLGLQSAEAKGLRPREWDSGMVSRILEADPLASAYIHCQLLAYYVRLDEGREIDALNHLEAAIRTSAHAARPLRHVLFLEAAAASALVRMQPARARTWLERACKLRKPELPDVVEAGIAMCEGRYEVASSRWRSAIDHVTRLGLDSGLIRFAKDRWATYEIACRGHEGRRVPPLDETRAL